MKVLITGVSGFIGRNLSRVLVERGHEVVGLSRSPSKIKKRVPSVKYVRWDGVSPSGWCDEVTEDSIIVNLAGESIFGLRWTKKKKQRIVQSRVEASNAVFECVEKTPVPVIQASAVGIYPEDTEEILNEDAESGDSFLASVCTEWERRAQNNTLSRTVILRIGMVLGRGGGAIGMLSLPFKLFVGGKVGSGKQMVPWIHLDDVINFIVFAIENPVSGIFNLVAPGILTNFEFSKALGRVLHRPSFFPTPGFVLKLLMGEMGSIALRGQRVSSRIQEVGYTFRYPDIDSALNEVFGKTR